ncbi:cytochrome c [Ramlibacter tataouinensis]|uniref:SorU family sulfite dehydrogenase c-type cytochrome subunit n=1 Tax=Ramlibacter tataouinensis TaxID=94132 RepID=UPI0022F404E5|nr:cytochrome c [Ramlibacter tataouinensis]WBY02983.1 cytochrome c [Ramlibacter tataouinensis]
MAGSFWKAAPLALLASLACSVQAEDEGRILFTKVTPSCALCHTLKDAGAEGAVGPSLDELKPDRARVVQALKTGIGQMPAFTHLTQAEIEALARYVERATK